MTRLTRAADGNLHGTPSKPATAPSASDRAHDQVTQRYDQRLSAHQLNVTPAAAYRMIVESSKVIRQHSFFAST
jgi:hypothetical protein